MSKYLSNRLKNLSVGISSYTENNTVLQVTGKVGIGTNYANHDLDISGDLKVSGHIYDRNNNPGSLYYVPVADNNGWTWQPITSAGGGTLNGINIINNGTIVGSSGSITTLDFEGNNIVVSADIGGNIATIFSSNSPTFNNVKVTGVVTATEYYGSGKFLTGIVPKIGIKTGGDVVGTAATLLEFRGTGIGITVSSSGIATININPQIVTKLVVPTRAGFATALIISNILTVYGRTFNTNILI